MTVRSIFEIDVNDSKFVAFQEKYELYKESLKDLPGVWSEVAKGTVTASGVFDQLVAKAGGQMAAVKLQALAQGKAVELMRKADYDAMSRQQKFLAGLRQADAIASSMADKVGRASLSTAKMAAHLAGSALSLLKWTSAVSVLSALVGVGGGLFGIERLAAGVADARRASMGSGASIGKRSAFSLDYGRFVDADSMLGNVSTALSDKTSRGYVGLLSAGVSPKFADTHDAADVSVEVLKRLPEIFKGVQPGLIGPTAQARGLTDILSVEDIKRYIAASPQERQQQEEAYRKDAKSLDVSGATARAWQDLVTQLQRAGSEIQNTFVTGLVPLAGPLGNLSKGVTDLVAALLKSDAVKGGIEGLAAGLEAASRYIGSDSFKDDLRYFAHGIGELAQSVRWALEKLGLVKPSVEEKAKEAGTSDRDAAIISNNVGVFGNAINRGRQGLDRIGHNAQSYQDRVTGKLQAFGGGRQGWWTPERQSHAVDALMRDAGLTEEGAKALVSRWKNVESPDGPSSSNNIGGGHRGIGQWGHNRQAGMGASFDDQLKHAADELNGPENRAKTILNTPMMGSVGASIFERGEGYDPRTGRDNFTAKTDAGMAGIAHSPELSKGYAANPNGADNTGRGDVIDRAQGMVGLREGEAAKALGHIMHAGEWCADFVNGTIEANGGKGSGSAMARSFMNWGKVVGIGQVKRGDVAVLNNGGHVGFFTGERDKQGRLGVIAGNTRDGQGGHAVRHYFVDPDSVTGARRGADADAAMAMRGGPARDALAAIHRAQRLQKDGADAAEAHQHIANLRRVLAARQHRLFPWQHHDFKADVQRAKSDAGIRRAQEDGRRQVDQPRRTLGLSDDRFQRKPMPHVLVQNNTGANVNVTAAMAGATVGYG